MRNLHDPNIECHRLKTREVLAVYGNHGDETCGAFTIPSRIDQQPLLVVASSDFGWDHVSVSRTNRVPNWYELEQVKRLFFKPDEVAMQLHVPSTEHISLHPHCLHLWRPHDGVIPLPPKEMVA